MVEENIFLEDGHYAVAEDNFHGMISYDLKCINLAKSLSSFSFVFLLCLF